MITFLMGKIFLIKISTRQLLVVIIASFAMSKIKASVPLAYSCKLQKKTAQRGRYAEQKPKNGATRTLRRTKAEERRSEDATPNKEQMCQIFFPDN